MQDNAYEAIKDITAPPSPVGNFPTGRMVDFDISQGKIGAEDMVIDGRVLRTNDRIYDLLDVVEEPPPAESNDGQEIIIIDGRVYERVARPGKELFAATGGLGTLRAPLLDNSLHDEIMKAAVKIAEAIVRESVPDIAERLIKEEIAKLKADNQLS